MHLALDADSNDIIAHVMTNQDAGDASQVELQFNQIATPIGQFTADGAYDGSSTYDAIARHSAGATLVIPPCANALERPDTGPSSQRDRHVAAINTDGRMKWQVATGYGKRSLVETAIGRYKSIIGNRLRACSFGASSIYSGLEGITFRVEGTIKAPDTGRAGISNTTDGTRIEIAESGMLDSFNGISDNAVGTKIVNDGYIKASSTALLLTGESTSIVNNGQIVAAQTAIDIQALDGGPFVIENNGLITGTTIIASFGPAVIMKFGADSVIRGSGYYMINVGSADSATLDNAGFIRAATGSFARLRNQPQAAYRSPIGLNVSKINPQNRHGGIPALFSSTSPE